MTFAVLGAEIERPDVWSSLDDRTRALITACDRHRHFEVLGFEFVGTSDTVAVIVDAGDGTVSPGNVAGLWRRERLALYYPPPPSDRLEVRALRTDFPSVPHLNAVVEGEPKSLCLFELDGDPVARRFSAAQLLNRILEWLEATAEGRLHQDEQALEAIFYGTGTLVILPSVVDGQRVRQGERLRVLSSDTLNGRHVVELGFGTDGAEPASGLYPLFVRLPPTGHGALQRQPHRLGDLDAALAILGSGLHAPLRAAVREAATGGLAPTPPGSKVHVLLVLEVPRARAEGAPVERVDDAAYLMTVDLGTLGIALGALHRAHAAAPAYAIPLVGGDYAEDATDAWRHIQIHGVDVRRHLSRELARRMTGTDPETAEFRGVLAGVGALGSALAEMWARSAWGRWHYIDPDLLEPHNVARHLGRQPDVGASKVRVVRAYTDAVLGESDPARQTLHAHADRVGETAVRAALEDADLLVDASTTLAVPREWAGVDSFARVASVFLTPSGQGGALLLEDARRSVRSDDLEAQYYRALITQAWGGAHLAPVAAIRSGAGCRDRSVVMAPDQVQLHAALLSQRLRIAVTGDVACIQVWSADGRGGSVTRHDVTVHPVQRAAAAGWAIAWDDGLFQWLVAERDARLPNETGGVLFGVTDQKRRTIHLVMASDAPSDSVASPTGFVRGTDGVEALREHVQLRTALMVDYVGEWHSHPRGVNARASSDDLALVESLAKRLNADGLPAVMVIVGEREIGLYLHEHGTEVEALKASSEPMAVPA